MTVSFITNLIRPRFTWIIYIGLAYGPVLSGLSCLLQLIVEKFHLRARSTISCFGSLDYRSRES